MKKCYLCGRTCFECVKGKVRDKPHIPILRCKKCGLIFLENFDHIHNDFYQNSKMREKESIIEWQEYLKECERDDIRRAAWLKKYLPGKSLLDFGCGAGGFLAKIKSYVKECIGLEKDKNLVKTVSDNFGIKVYTNIGDIKKKFDIITLFHVLEHIKDPRALLKKVAGLLKAKGEIIVEVPNANDALLTLYDSKAFSEFTYWSCHLYTFNTATLRKLIESSGLVIEYMKLIQRYPLSNHLYWLSKGKAGGHKEWEFLNSKRLHVTYETLLAKHGMCDTIIASVRSA